VLEREIYLHYQLYVDRLFTFGNYDGFSANGKHYVIIPVHECSSQDVRTIISLTHYLQHKGERSISTIVPTIHNAYGAKINGVDIFLFCLPPLESLESELSIGAQLAKFHQAGKGFPYAIPNSNRFGTWASLWVKRLEGLKKKYQERLMQAQRTEFDHAFISSFPYYEGLAENAIQYMVDYEFERGGSDQLSSTICHQRFSGGVWIQATSNEKALVKLPVHYVIDHPMRDVAEWIRGAVHRNSPKDNIAQFLSDYINVSPVNIGSWRLLYARLLLPITYFDIVESYYQAKRNYVKIDWYHKLQEILAKEEENEKFLRSFFDDIGLNTRSFQIPEVDWLTSQV
jgi:spore coat protein YutH